MPPETFVMLFILVAMAGSSFLYWVVVASSTYIVGIMVATELSKIWGI